MTVIFPQLIKINPNNRYNQFYFNKGYKIIDNKIEINIEDLQERSATKIKCICDNCKVKFEKSRSKIKDLLGETYCSKCAVYSARKTCINKYGVEFALQSKSVQDGIKKRNIKKYGVSCTFKVEEVRNKIKDTLLKRYNVDNISKLRETIEKIKQTNIERIGCEFPIQNKNIRSKIQKSYFKKTGKNFNVNFIAKSKNQIKIAELINGEINKDIGVAFADVVLEDKKIVIEYDGGGHNLPVILGKITQEEFDLKELKRENNILNQNYKIIRMISKRDYLPNDNELINIINDAIYLLTNSNANVIKINISKEAIEYV